MSIEKKIKITLDASSAKKGLDALATRLSGLSAKTNGAAGATGRYSKANKTLNQNLINTNRSLNAMQGLLVKVASAATVISGVRLADDFNELQNKLRLTVQEGDKLLDVQNDIVDISLKTRSSLKENGLLYLRLSNAVDRASVSQEELLRVTETVNKAVQTGGSSAQEAAGAVRQFTQIVSSGFVSGFSQEINSLSEQTPGLFNLIVDGLRETSTEFQELEASGTKGVSALKKFSEEGIGNLDMLLAAIASQAGNVDAAFDNINITVSKALGNVKTAVENYIGGVDDAFDITGSLANSINNVAENFDQFALEASIATAVLVSATASVVAFNAAITTTKILLAATTGSVGKLGRISKILVRALRVLTPVLAIFGGIALGLKALIEDLAVFEDGLVKVGDKTTTLGGFLTALFKALKNRITEFGSNSVRIFNSIVDEIGAALSYAYNTYIKPFVDVFISAFNSTKNALENSIARLTDYSWFNDFTNGVKNNLNTIIGFFVLFGRVVKTVVKNIIDTLKQIFTGTLEVIKALPKVLIKLGTGKFSEAGKVLGDALVAGFVGVDIIGDVKADLEDAKEILGETDFIGGIGGSVDNVIGKIADFTSKLPDLLKSAARGAKDGFIFEWEKFKDEVEALIVGISETIGDNTRFRGPASDDEIDFRTTLEKIKDAYYDFTVEMRSISDDLKDNLKELFSGDSLVFAFESALDFISSSFERFKDSLTIESIVENFNEIANAMGDAYVSFTDLFTTLSSIRQDKIDEELRTSINMSDEERKVKEANAKKAFDNAKKLTLAGIAMQTGLAIMNALSDQSTPSYLINLANAAGAAATGAAQYAKANAQSYTAPSPPSASSIQGATSNETVNNTQVTVNITGGDPNRVAQQLVEAFDNNELTFENGRFNSV